MLPLRCIRGTRTLASSPPIHGARVYPNPVISSNFRCLTISAWHGSGHSKWAKIKHDKAKFDKRKAGSFSKLSRDIIEATKYGGPDPATNLRLAAALEASKKSGLSKATIENALKRGQGISTSGAPLETVLIECIGPGGVGILIETMTDSKLRTLQDLRTMIKDEGQNMAPTQYLFTRKGYVHAAAPHKVQKDDEGLDTLIECTLDLDVEDVNHLPEHESEKQVFEVTVPEPTMTAAVAKALSETVPEGWEIIKSGISFYPNDETLLAVDEATATELGEFVGMLEENGDVVEVFTNADYQ